MEIVVTNLFRNETKKGVFRMRKNKCSDFNVLADENRPSSTGHPIQITQQILSSIIMTKLGGCHHLWKLEVCLQKKYFITGIKLRNNHFQKVKVLKLKYFFQFSAYFKNH